MDTPISRRVVLGGTVAATVAGATTIPAYGADVQITDSAGTVSLVAVPDGAGVPGYVKVLDGGGVHRFDLTTFEYAYMSGETKVVQRTTGIASITPDGPQQFMPSPRPPRARTVPRS